MTQGRREAAAGGRSGREAAAAAGVPLPKKRAWIPSLAHPRARGCTAAAAAVTVCTHARPPARAHVASRAIVRLLPAHVRRAAACASIPVPRARQRLARPVATVIGAASAQSEAAPIMDVDSLTGDSSSSSASTSTQSRCAPPSLPITHLPHAVPSTSLPARSHALAFCS